MDLRTFQEQIERLYLARDRRRGLARTFLWFTEEVGELAEALRRGDAAAREAEFADVLAWLATLASLTGVDLEAAARARYGRHCPKCRKDPCGCPEA